MKEAIELIRRQMVACNCLKERLEDLKVILRKGMDGSALGKATKGVESMFGEFSRLEEEQKKFLAARKRENMVDFVQAQPASVERDVAMRLLLQIEALHKELSGQMAIAGELLQKGQEFVAFHVNVHSQAKAAGTYGPPGGVARTGGNVKMFDANV